MHAHHINVLKDDAGVVEEILLRSVIVHRSDVVKEHTYLYLSPFEGRFLKTRIFGVSADSLFPFTMSFSLKMVFCRASRALPHCVCG